MASCSCPFPASSISVKGRTGSPTICSVFKWLPFPRNPEDPFPKKLRRTATDSPELFRRGRVTMGNILNDPNNSYSAKITMSSMRRPRAESPPPDMPSIMFDSRIIDIDMPLVPIVTELIIAELLYLQWDSPTEPIYLHINSTGTTTDDGQPVATEGEGFAIYDAMMSVKNEIHTVCVGAAAGQACLLLAAGTKGKRYIYPHSTAVMQQPRLPPSGLQQASDTTMRAKEVMLSRDLYVELMAEHTGNTIETIAEKVKNPYFMDAVEARDFGVVDKIIWLGQKEMMKRVVPSESWEESAIDHKFYWRR